MENKPVLSKKGLYGYVIGSAVGAGMFVTLPAAIGHTGRSVILAVLLASLVYFFAYWYCVSLSSLASIKGADYGYLSFVSSPMMSGVYGLTNLFWLIGNCVYASGAVEYIGVFVPFVAKHVKLFTVLLITLFMLIDYIGVSLGAKVEGVMTVILVVSLLVFLIMGATMVEPRTFFCNTVSDPFFTGGFTGFSKSMALCIWVIGGIGTATITFARDVENPTRTIPRCVVFVTLFITAIGALICYVCAGVLPIEEATKGVNVVAEAVLPSVLFPVFVIGGAAFALLSTLQTYIISYRVAILAHAEDGFLPKVFTCKTQKGYPWVVGLLIWIASVVPYLFDITLDTVVAYTGVPAYVMLIYVNIKLLKVPARYPELWQKSAFRRLSMPLWYVVCIFSTICSCYLVYCYVADFSFTDLGWIILAVGAMFAWGFYRMKSGKADINKIREEKEEIIRDALAYANQK